MSRKKPTFEDAGTAPDPDAPPHEQVGRKQRKTPKMDPRRNQIAPAPGYGAVIPPQDLKFHSNDDEIIAAEGIPPGDDPDQVPAIGLQAAAEARQWVGTPYHHQASLKAVGCDCLGLLRGIYRAIVGPEPEAVPNYSPAWDEVSRRDDMLAAFRAHLVPRPFDPRRRDATELQAGDVLIFRMRPAAVAKHCGIVVAGDAGGVRFVHSHSGRGTVEIELTEDWRKKIVAVFAFPAPSANVRKVEEAGGI